MQFGKYIGLFIISIYGKALFASEIIVGDPTVGISAGDSLLAHVGEDPEDTIAHIISYGLGVVTVLAILAVTWAGIQMVLASGDEEKVKKSRQMLIYSFVGVMIAGLGYGMVTFILNVNLNSFL